MDFIKSLKEDSWRMLIMGKTKSGKTHLTMKTILPAVSKSFDVVIVFTRKFNEKYYEKQFENIGRVPKKEREGDRKYVILTFDDDANIRSDVINAINNVKKTQLENVKEYDEEGIPEYNDRILLIFDDILDEYMMQLPDFMSMFISFRHIDISVILLSQISNKAISTQMKANTEHSIFFDLNNQFQRRYPIEVIADTFPDIEDKIRHQKAEEMYKKKCVETKYGYLIVSDGKLI